MSHYLIFDGLLVSVLLLAFLFGEADAKAAASLCLIATFLSNTSIHATNANFSSVEGNILFIDVATLLAFIMIAFVSARFWPLWTAGLQLTTLLAHVLRALDSALVPKAYYVAAAFWSYPILFIVALGSWRGYRRRNSDSA